MAKKEMTFETAMARLQEIVGQLEDNNGSLEQAMKLFEEGTKMAEVCRKALSAAELKLSQLSEWEETAVDSAENA